MNSEEHEDRTLMGNEEDKKTTAKGGSDRFQAIVAILIAVVSVISAGVIWRASMAGSNASDADRRGLVTTVQYEASYAQTVSTLYQEARYATQHARYQARVATLQAQDSKAAHTEAEWVNEILISMALFTPLTTDPAYRTSDGGLDLDKRLADLRDADADLRDLGPQQKFDAADQFHTEAQVLLSIVIIFAVALFFLTLAEITRHKIRFGLAAVGIAIFLLALGGLLVTELYFVLPRLIAA